MFNADYIHDYVVTADQADIQYTDSCRVAWTHALDPAHRDVLRQLVEKEPVWDGDVASKAARDDLIAVGLASRACVRGEQGYTVANYCGWDVLRAGEPK